MQYLPYQSLSLHSEYNLSFLPCNRGYHITGEIKRDCEWFIEWFIEWESDIKGHLGRVESISLLVALVLRTSSLDHLTSQYHSPARSCSIVIRWQSQRNNEHANEVLNKTRHSGRTSNNDPTTMMMMAAMSMQVRPRTTTLAMVTLKQWYHRAIRIVSMESCLVQWLLLVPLKPTTTTTASLPLPRLPTRWVTSRYHQHQANRPLATPNRPMAIQLHPLHPTIPTPSLPINQLRSRSLVYNAAISRASTPTKSVVSSGRPSTRSRTLLPVRSVSINLSSYRCSVIVIMIVPFPTPCED